MPQKEKYINEVNGTIVSVDNARFLSPAFVTVRYSVEGKTYQIKERVRCSVQRARVGGFGIGNMRMPVLKNLDIGVNIRVRYRPEKPQKAYLPDNRLW